MRRTRAADIIPGGSVSLEAGLSPPRESAGGGAAPEAVTRPKGMARPIANRPSPRRTRRREINRKSQGGAIVPLHLAQEFVRGPVPKTALPILSPHVIQATIFYESGPRSTIPQ